MFVAQARGPLPDYAQSISRMQQELNDCAAMALVERQQREVVIALQCSWHARSVC